MRQAASSEFGRGTGRAGCDTHRPNKSTAEFCSLSSLSGKRHGSGLNSHSAILSLGMYSGLLVRCGPALATKSSAATVSAMVHCAETAAD